MSFFFIDDAPAVSAVTFVNSASSTGSTITVPADAAAGDIAVLYDIAQMTAGLPTLVIPSGWTNQANSSVNTTRAAVATKLLGSGDPGAVITGMNGNNRNKKGIVVFRPDTPVMSVTASTFTSAVVDSPSDNPQQTISASGKSTPLIVLGGTGTGSTGTVSFSVASPAFDSTVATASELTIGYKLYAAGSSPSDHSIDVTVGTNRSLWGGYLLLA